MLLVGNTPCPPSKQADPPHGLSCGVLSHVEEKTQMAVWAMASAPLQMGNDLTAVPNASRSILLNTEVIAVDQVSTSSPMMGASAHLWDLFAYKLPVNAIQNHLRFDC